MNGKNVRNVLQRLQRLRFTNELSDTFLLKAAVMKMKLTLFGTLVTARQN